MILHCDAKDEWVQWYLYSDFMDKKYIILIVLLKI